MLRAEEEAHMASIEPSSEQLRRLVAEAADDTPIVMINLLRYRARAAYPPGSTADPCSGREAYQRYGTSVTPMLAEAGGRILWFGSVKQMVIGPEAEQWDDAILVQYPSRRAFLGMVGRQVYQEAAVHRTAALADSRLIATTTALNVL
jgi:uncharacterized protein (DUF1330 family)